MAGCTIWVDKSTLGLRGPFLMHVGQINAGTCFHCHEDLDMTHFSLAVSQYTVQRCSYLATSCTLIIAIIIIVTFYIEM